MKKVNFKWLPILGGLFFTCIANAQNVVPSSGAVGIGTTQPTQQLEVVGNIKADSCVIVGDSLIVDKNARVGKDMKVSGQLFVADDITGDKDLNINKNATIGKNLTVDKKIITPNMPEAQNMNNKQILVRGANGVLKAMDLDLIVMEIYSPFLCPTDVNGESAVLPPVWSSEPNKLYTGTAPCTDYPLVGIGTNDPQARLEIVVDTDKAGDALLISNENQKIFQLEKSGLVRSREVKVDAFEWPDYVFKKDYDLMPLDEVEKFIEKEGHLPNVPSAAEVEKEGQSLGEMNKILLEKVEELTLHLIRQQKEIDELKAKLDKNDTANPIK